jgi:hypothetical protein
MNNDSIGSAFRDTSVFVIEQDLNTAPMGRPVVGVTFTRKVHVACTVSGERRRVDFLNSSNKARSVARPPSTTMHT